MSWSEGPRNRDYTYDDHRYHFAAFACDPRFLGAVGTRQRPLDRRRSWPGRMASSGTPVLLAVPLFLGLLVVVNLLQGTFGHGDVPSVWLRDARRSLGLIQTSEVGIDGTFPLMRDTVSVVIALLVSVNLSVLYRQWAVFETLIPDLLRNGGLAIVPGQEAKVRHAIRKMNRLFSWCGNGSGLLLLLFMAVVGALYLFFQQEDGGVFYGFAPVGLEGADRVGWAQAAYENWWASNAGSRAGLVLYVALAAVAIYYMFLQNVVGFRVVGFFLRHGKRVSFVANPANPDGEYGWAPVGRLMMTVYFSVGVHFISLWLLALIFINGLNRGIALPTAVLAIAGPLYVLAPIVILYPAMSRFKRSEYERIRVETEKALNAGVDEMERFEIRERSRREVEAVQGMSAFPFSRRALIAVAIYIGPIVTAVFTLLRAGS